MIELKSAICPECGGLLRLNVAHTQGICKSCGTTIIISGAPGIKQELAAWISANHQLEDGDTDKADKYFKQVLDINPEFGEAYFARFECAVQSAEYYLQLNSFMERCTSEYVDSIEEAIRKYGNRAVEYAPDSETKAEYESRLREVQQRVETVVNSRSKKRGLFSRLFG